MGFRTGVGIGDLGLLRIGGFRSDACKDSYVPFVLAGKLLHSHQALRLYMNVGLSIYHVSHYTLSYT